MFTYFIPNPSYNIAYSGDFESGSSQYLVRSNSGTTDSNLKGTVSFWLKRESIGTRQVITGGKTDDDNKCYFEFDTSDRIGCHFKRNGSWQCDMVTTATYTSTSDWYHFHLNYDSTQATATDRFTLTINGSTIDSTNSNLWDTYDLPGSNESMRYLENGENTQIGRYADQASYFDGKLADFYGIAGEIFDHTYFGETIGGVWVPKRFTETPSGTLSFYLKFGNSSDLGEDSFQDNGFTNVNGVTRSTDTPTS